MIHGPYNVKILQGVSCFRLLEQKASFLYLAAPVSEMTGLTVSYNINLQQVFSMSPDRNTE